MVARRLVGCGSRAISVLEPSPDTLSQVGEHEAEHLRFAGEVVLDGTHRHVGLAGDVAEADRLDAAVADHCEDGLGQRALPLVSVHLFGHGTSVAMRVYQRNCSSGALQRGTAP